MCVCVCVWGGGGGGGGEGTCSKYISDYSYLSVSHLLWEVTRSHVTLTASPCMVDTS